MTNHDRVIEIWKQGYNYRDAGKQLGITGERVRQIVREHHANNCSEGWVSPNSRSGPYCSCVQAHRRGRDNLKRRSLARPQIELDFRSGMPVQEIAKRHKVDQQMLWEATKHYSAETKAVRKTNMWKANRTQNDALTLAGYIKQVADKLGHAPTRAEYDAHREKGWPSSQTVCIRFGYWSHALQSSGLVISQRSAKVSRPRSDKHWTEPKILDALHYLYNDTGEVPSISHYRKLASETAWLPSDQVVRRSWRWPDVRLRVMNEHSEWTPTYSKLDLVDPYNRRGRPKKDTTNNQGSGNGSVWATQP